MFYQPDWEKSVARYHAFWAGEIIDRPVIQAYAPKHAQRIKGTERILDETVWRDPEPTVRAMETLFANTHFAGDAFPMWFPNLGPGALTAYLGNPLHFDSPHDTSWQEHMVADLPSWRPHLDPANPLWQATLALTRRIAQAAHGRFICGITDLGMGIDLLSALRGPDGLCLDLLDCPDLVAARLTELRALWQSCYQALYDLFPPGNGSHCWMPAWAPGKTFPLQGDFTCMISTDMFEKIVLPDLQAYCRWLDYPIYHLDGPAALKHLDLLLSIPELRAIQWTAGAGQPPLPHWIPMLQRVQQAGKGLFLYGSPAELDPVMTGLRPQGVIFHAWAPTPAQAESLVAQAAQWR